MKPVLALVLASAVVSAAACKTPQTQPQGSTPSDAVTTSKGKPALLFAGAKDSKVVCMASCSEDPVAAMRNGRYDACGVAGKSLPIASVEVFVAEFISASGGSAQDARAITETFVAAPQSTIDDPGTQRPKGLVQAAQGVAAYMLAAGAEDATCNPEQHLKEYRLAIRVNETPVETAGSSQGTQGGQAGSTRPQSSGELPEQIEGGYYPVCGSQYKSFWTGKSFTTKCPELDDAACVAAVMQRCKTFATAGYEQNCKATGCLHVSQQTFTSSLGFKWWASYESSSEVARIERDSKAWVDDYGSRLYTERPAYRAPCFPGETLVDTPDGPRAIADLAIGDAVLAYDFAAKKVVVDQVVATTRRRATELLTLRLADGTELRTTPDHPFFDATLGNWRRAAALTEDSTLVRVGEIDVGIGVESIETLREDVEVFNLTTSGTHTYFAAGVLVHNY